jgi:hypothetical protein
MSVCQDDILITRASVKLQMGNNPHKGKDPLETLHDATYDNKF